MTGKPPDRHQLAVAILAIATAAIGFGLFAQFDGPSAPKPELQMVGLVADLISVSRFVLISLTVVSYFLLLEKVSRLLSRDNLSGSELVNGPMTWLFVEMACLTGLHLSSLLIGL